MNTLVKHLKEVCKRNGAEPDPANMISFLIEMDDESIIEILNSKDIVSITLKYGLIDVDIDSMPPGLQIQVKDYDIQPEPDAQIQKDEIGPYFLHEFQRSM